MRSLPFLVNNMTQSLCYVCEQEVIKAYGYSRSKVLLIGSAPGDDELEAMIPFVGQTGKVLRKEMAMVGMDLYSCVTTNLWYHKPPKSKDKNFEPCFNASIDVVMQEAKGKDAILLIGAEPVHFFTEHKVSEVNGLQVDSNRLSAPIIYAMMQPTVVYKGGGVGEIRFALQNFSSHLKKEGII